jgi:hypothetical protein
VPRPIQPLPEPGRKVLGLLADPGVPAEIAGKIADDLTEVSGAHPDAVPWRVRTEVRTLPPLTDAYDELLAVASRRIHEDGLDGIVCVTDSPLRDGRYALVADLLRAARVALVSLPAFGALPLRRHVGAVAAELTEELTEPPERHQSKEGEQRQAGAATKSRRFRRVHSPDPDVTVRITASHAAWRLLVGLVRANQPWRLLGGLKGALGAALATSAYVLINPSAWQFADQVSGLKLGLMTVFATAGMVTWLVTAHNLWERPADPVERSRVRLFNASTLVTLLVGVGCGYVVLFAANLLAEAFLIDPGFLQVTLGHPTTIGDYLAIAWFTSSVAVLAGAVGSTFEDESTVRRVAYSRRERERHQAHDNRGNDGHQ